MQETEETWFGSLGQEDPLEKGMATHSIFLPGESQGQRSLVGYSPWARTELDRTEPLTVVYLLVCFRYYYPRYSSCMGEIF